MTTESHPLSLHSIYVGQPQTMVDGSGEWRSSIFRTPVSGPVRLTEDGLEGDQVTDTENHGKKGYQEVCCHSLAHYHFWRTRYDIAIEPGGVGENWTLDPGDESEIFLHDIYRVGTATVQVSAPRVPCSKQARRVGRADWVKLTLQELRPGFYLRVLEPGMVESGDLLHLVERPLPWASLTDFNRTVYHALDPGLADRLLSIDNLHPYWQEQLRSKLDRTPLA